MAINKAVIQVRRGPKEDLQIDKLLPGELAIATNAPCMWFCWAVGKVEQVPTSDNIEEVIAEIIKEYLKDNPITGISEIYMRVYDGYIQYSSDNETWVDLLPLSDLKTDVTPENITQALGYTPAKQEEVNELSQEIAKISIGTIVEWDGNTEGKGSISDGTNTLYYVSDKILSIDELIGLTVSLDYYDEHIDYVLSASDLSEDISVVYINGNISGQIKRLGLVLKSSQTNLESGIYLNNSHEIFVKGLYGPSEYAKKEDVENLSQKIPTKTSQIENDSGFITKAASDLANYYLKSETYSQSEINQRLSAIPKFAIQVVSALPTTDISTTTVYLLKSGEEDQNLYTEYIYVDGAWEYLGSQSVDLSGYALKENIPVKLSELTNDAGYITNTVQNLVYYYSKTENDQTFAKKATTLAGYGITDGATKEQFNQLSQEIVDYKNDIPTEVENQLDGAKADIVAELIAQIGGMPVFGTVDDNNIITVTSQLSEGTYTLMYENEDGSITEIGEITIEGEVIPNYTNLANPTSSDWQTDVRINSSGSTVTQTGNIISNLIECPSEEFVVHVKGLNLLNSASSPRVYSFTSDKTYSGFAYNTVSDGICAVSDYDSNVYVLTLTNITQEYFAIGGALVGTAEDVIITIDEQII